MRLSREEMETHLYFSEEVDCEATICTFNGKLKRKIMAASEQFPDLVKIKNEDNYGEMIATLPKNLISLNIKTPKTLDRKRTMSEEQKKAFVERTQKARLLK